MSRIGVKPIPVPNTVTITVNDGNAVSVKGPKGELSQGFASRLSIIQEDGTVRVERPTDDGDTKALHGLTRSLLNNMVVGVTTGYTRNLEILGVGYRAAMDGKNLVLNVGYSHPVRMVAPDGISYAVEG
ncbi:MAG TPA: 50S ribosomal protein L6, partial [Thermomicrobiales bacterium]|nr:50S ribosomal protein L6 [Thermomicrobiales bacterium]